MPAFVLEIGTEELPARFLANAEKELARGLAASLEKAGFGFSGLEAASTPRRLTVSIASLDAAAAVREEVVTGPPLKAAFDLGGRPTRAAEGFARVHGVSLEETFTLETEKGGYLAVRKRLGGERALDALSALCPDLVLGLSFPKRMRWGAHSTLFARPLRWVLALLGEEVVPFSLGPLVSGRETFGHRVHGPGPFAVASAEAYFSVVRESCAVVLRSGERRAIIREQGDLLASEKQAAVLWKESLLDEVQGLCEHPVPILGTFDPAFLEVPREVLLTSMESHQKSFGVEGPDGALRPYFLTVLNIRPRDFELVRKGWERVLRARLEDARFFWRTDLAAGFEPWLRELDNVIFLAPLGSMGDKTRRVAALCAWLAGHMRSMTGEALPDAEIVMRAGRLSKADLVSEMVKEFDTLQGIMGGIYAEKTGEAPEVAAALAQQYLPAGPESPVPASLAGAILSIADKADTLAGCFGLGMIPTGTADPYALRRAALGIARIAVEKQLRLDVPELFRAAFAGYEGIAWKLEPDQALARLEEFFNLRLKNHFTAAGAQTLLAEAVILAGARDVWAASARLAALDQFSKSGAFDQAVLTFKRAANIIRKQGGEEGLELTGCYNRALFEDPAETSLADELERVLPLFAAQLEKDAYGELFLIMRDLRPFVDAFFESVMVMCDDEEVRLNRLNLLQALVTPLERLADFSALQM